MKKFKVKPLLISMAIVMLFFALCTSIIMSIAGVCLGDEEIIMEYMLEGAILGTIVGVVFGIIAHFRWDYPPPKEKEEGDDVLME